MRNSVLTANKISVRAKQERMIVDLRIDEPPNFWWNLVKPSAKRIAKPMLSKISSIVALWKGMAADQRHRQKRRMKILLWLIKNNKLPRIRPPNHLIQWFNDLHENTSSILHIRMRTWPGSVHDSFCNSKSNRNKHIRRRNKRNEEQQSRKKNSSIIGEAKDAPEAMNADEDHWGKETKDR